MCNWVLISVSCFKAQFSSFPFLVSVFLVNHKLSGPRDSIFQLIRETTNFSSLLVKIRIVNC